MKNQLPDPSYAIKIKFFEHYIRPYLKKEPENAMLAYFYEQGWTAWILRIGKNELKEMLLVYGLCDELFQKFPDDFAMLVSSVLAKDHEVTSKSIMFQNDLYDAHLAEDVDQIISHLIRQYKNIFESELRLWATVPYFYIVRVCGSSPELEDIKDFIQVSGGRKYDLIKKQLISKNDVNFNDLVLGFDNEIRNAGEGHDDWEITDDDKILFKLHNPNTGASKGKGQIVVSQEEFQDQIKLCRGKIWVMKMGLLIYLNNNPELSNKVSILKIFSKREIISNLESLAFDNCLEIKKINIATDKLSLDLELKYSPPLLGESGQVFFGNGEAYDMVKMKNEVSYKYQILGVLQRILYFFNGKAPHLDLKIFDEHDQCLADLEIASDELKKLLLPKDEKNIPLLSKGDWPTGTYIIEAELPVPYGMGPVIQKKIDEEFSTNKGQTI